MHNIKDVGDYEYGCSSVENNDNSIIQLFRSFIPKQVIVMTEKHIA